MIPGMTTAVDAVEAAIRANKRILIFGDFDLDGVSATAIMVLALRALGNDPSYLIPNRIDEGYGLTQAALARVYELDPELLITVDCGISARDEVESLLRRGIEVVITDHHEASGLVPEGIPITDPKLVDGSPAGILAGAGVALKLVALLGARFGKPQLWLDFVDLATLGTIADIMPLIGENRSLVVEGLKQINLSPRLGIAASLALCRKAKGDLSASELSYGLIPRLNAAGRMGDATLALELLISDESAHSAHYAELLELLNQQRRDIEAQLILEASRQAEARYVGQHILVLADEDWHEGVKGIAASRLAKRFGIPVIVFTLDGDEARGSGRSVGTVNLFQAVSSCEDLTLRYGGHEAAVGVTVHRQMIAVFKDRMEQILADEPREHFHPALDVDVRLKLAEIDVDGIAELQKLEPFGQENKQPLFVSTNIFLKSARAVGVAKNHLSCVLSDGFNDVAAIYFNCPNIDTLLGHEGLIDVIYNLCVDTWNGLTKPKALIKQINPVVRVKDEGSAQRQIVDITDHPPRSGDRAFWRKLAREDGARLTTALQEALIGPDCVLHEAQSLALHHLHMRESVLTVMATGGGKSLIFQLHAAKTALRDGQASIFVYPLRALIADQEYHLKEIFAGFGLVLAVVTGESDSQQREAVFNGLQNGDIDIVLTTPEFLYFNTSSFASAKNVGFLVIDEAHHIAVDRLGYRPVYGMLRNVLTQFNALTVLAVTATADHTIARTIVSELGIQHTVVDSRVRENLCVEDYRDTNKRQACLASLVMYEDKTLIYVNSRDESIVLTRMLRKRLPFMATRVAFYHAGLSRDDRKVVESLFRAGEMRAIVSTSAFGEGINLPDIQNVVLYHLPFNEVAFNQLSGRAGRDGRQAKISLLYGRADVSINKRILLASAPQRDDLATLYRALRNISPTNLRKTNSAELLRECLRINPHCGFEQKGIIAALAIFTELGLIEEKGISSDTDVRSLVLTKVRERVELTSSCRYLEGCKELLSFEEFKEWALSAPISELQTRVSAPILPDMRLLTGQEN